MAVRSEGGEQNWSPSNPDEGTSFWHYEFVLNGKRYHKSTKMTKEREALKIANAAFTALVKGGVGIGEPKPVPTLRSFREDFITAVKAEKQEKPKTVQFYTYSFDSLLKYGPLAEARLDGIDERLGAEVHSLGSCAQLRKGMRSAIVASPR